MNTHSQETLSIIIPIYNEARTLLSLLDAIQKVPLIGGIKKEIILVNDGSTDETDAVIETYMRTYPSVAIRYLQHSINEGKGASLHTGISAATGQYILIQDADLEYDPREYNTLLTPLVCDSADVVYGSRFISGDHYSPAYLWHAFGNKILTVVSNFCTGLHLTDVYTGYKLFRTSLLQPLHLTEKRFGFEAEITARIARIPHMRICEVGISYHGRTYKEGKKIGWKDGIRALLCILLYSSFLKK